MYSLRNKIQLIGHVGNDPEVKTTEDGKKLVRLSLATNESYRNTEGEKVTNTQWHQIIAWGAVAEIAEKFLEKGTQVGIEGKLINRSYTDKEGIKRLISEIQCSEILLLGPKPE